MECAVGGVVVVVVDAGGELVVDEMVVTVALVVGDVVVGANSDVVGAEVLVVVAGAGVDSGVGSNAQLVTRASEITRPERKERRFVMHWLPTSGLRSLQGSESLLHLRNACCRSSGQVQRNRERIGPRKSDRRCTR